VFYDDPSDAITVDSGSDVNDIFLYLEDPLPGRQAAAVAWPAQESKRNELLKRISAAMQKHGHKQEVRP
jgi:hypothetical protein